MTRREAYLDMERYTPGNGAQDSAPNANGGRGLTRSEEAAMANARAAKASSQRSKDYLAGLFLILIVLLVGTILGYFGRDLVLKLSHSGPELQIFGTQPISDSDLPPAPESSNAVFLGSAASDQILAVEPSINKDALLLIKTHLGTTVDESISRLARFSESNRPDEGHTLTELTELKGNGLYMKRLPGGALIALSTRSNNLIVSRINDAGSVIWTNSYKSQIIDDAEVTMSVTSTGFVLMAPTEDRTLSRLVSIRSDGTREWERVFDRPKTLHRPFLAVDGLGQTFAILGPSIRDANGNDQNLIMLDSSGRVLRQRSLTLNMNDDLAGIVARDQGGVSFLVSGTDPRLIHLDSTGQGETMIDLPHMQYFTKAKLLPGDRGDIFIASAYELMSGRVDLQIEQRLPDGSPGERRSFILPTGASLDSVSRSNQSEFLISGSVLRERYSRERFMPGDLFIQRVPFGAGENQYDESVSGYANEPASLPQLRQTR